MNDDNDWQWLMAAKRLINEFRKLKLESPAIQRQKSKQITRLKAVIPAIAGILLTFSNYSLLADDYLKELSTEAKATAAVSKKSHLDSTEKKELKQMENLLKTEKPSTYKYYVKLSKKKKERAFEAYANDQSDSNKRLHHLQKKVMDLYFGQ